MVEKEISFEFATLFHTPYRRVKKRGKFKANLSVHQMESFLYLFSSIPAMRVVIASRTSLRNTDALQWHKLGALFKKFHDRFSLSLNFSFSEQMTCLSVMLSIQKLSILINTTKIVFKIDMPLKIFQSCFFVDDNLLRIFTATIYSNLFWFRKYQPSKV